jgi:hypothetical protein
MNIEKEKEISQISNIISESEYYKNIDKVKECLLNTNFKYLDQAKKERLIFQEAIAYLNYRKTSYPLLHYLIFDYRISEINSIDTVNHNFVDVEKAKEMFAQRKLNDELQKELEIDNSDIHHHKKSKL